MTVSIRKAVIALAVALAPAAAAPAGAETAAVRIPGPAVERLARPEVRRLAPRTATAADRAAAPPPRPRAVLAATQPALRDLTSAALIDRRLHAPGGPSGVARAASPGDALAQASAQRRARGLGVLRADRRLQRAAQAHADWMARNGVMAHRGEGGRRFTHRMAQAGYGGFCFGAENVAYGQRDGREVVTAWMRSAPHRRALLDPRARDAAVAKATDGRGRSYWTMLLGQPC